MTAGWGDGDGLEVAPIALPSPKTNPKKIPFAVFFSGDGLYLFVGVLLEVVAMTKLYTIREAARAIGVPYRTVHSAVHEGRIPDSKFKLGCHRGFDESELKAMKDYFARKVQA